MKWTVTLLNLEQKFKIMHKYISKRLEHILDAIIVSSYYCVTFSKEAGWRNKFVLYVVLMQLTYLYIPYINLSFHPSFSSLIIFAYNKCCLYTNLNNTFEVLDIYQNLKSFSRQIKWYIRISTLYTHLLLYPSKNATDWLQQHLFMHYLSVYDQSYVARGREREQTLVDYIAVLLQAFYFTSYPGRFEIQKKKNTHTGLFFIIWQKLEDKLGRQIVEKSELHLYHKINLLSDRWQKGGGWKRLPMQWDSCVYRRPYILTYHTTTKYVHSYIHSGVLLHVLLGLNQKSLHLITVWATEILRTHPEKRFFCQLLAATHNSDYESCDSTPLVSFD